MGHGEQSRPKNGLIDLENMKRVKGLNVWLRSGSFVGNKGRNMCTNMRLWSNKTKHKSKKKKPKALKLKLKLKLKF